MTMFPNDDKDLVDFLHQYRPEVPSASPELEERILQQLEINSVVTSKVETSKRKTSLSQRLHIFFGHTSFWLIPSVMATGLLAAVISYRVLTPTEPSAAQIADLQSIMESDWYYKFNQNPRGELLHLTDTDADNNQTF